MLELSVQSLDGTLRNISPRKRQFEKVPAAADYLKLNRQRVGEIADETVDLSDIAIEEAKNEWEEERKLDPEKGKTIPGSLYRRYRQRPLLTIHLIEPRDPKDESKHKDRMMLASEIEAGVLVAVGLSFPKFEDGDKAARVPYRLNKVALRSMGLIADQEEEDREQPRHTRGRATVARHDEQRDDADHVVDDEPADRPQPGPVDRCPEAALSGLEVD